MTRDPMLGRSFGRITVRERIDAVIGLGVRTRGTAYLCACRCGGLIVARGSDLRAGKVSACGCVARWRRTEGRGRTFEPPHPGGLAEALALVALMALVEHDATMRVQDLETIAAVGHVTAWRALVMLHRRRMVRRRARSGPGCPARYTIAARGIRWLVTLRLGEVSAPWADEARARTRRTHERALRIVCGAKIPTSRRRAA